MLKTIRNVFKNYLLICLLSIALGIALVIEPTFLTRLVSYILGGVSLGFGVYFIARYFIKDQEGMVFLMIRGIVLAFIGVFLIVRPDFIPRMISTAFGIYMLVNGVIGLTNATEIKRSGDAEWQFPMISAGITFFLGFVICINPMLPVKAAMTVLGICLIISGASNLFSMFTSRSKLRRFEDKEQDDDKKDKPDIIDI
ncbi:MAG: DUF308 domain-containing protein [Ruminococcus sp.]|nr:DUF308 domain-containing protein [Ruminococcus sp.]